MKIVIDFSEKDWQFLRNTYKEKGLYFVPSAVQNECVKAVYNGQKALEQESILDKIRAEMEFEVDHRTNMLCAEDVFAIIDKYKVESEEGAEK